MSETRPPRKKRKKQTNSDQLEDMAMALYIHAAELLKAGKSREAVQRQLVRQGVDPSTARTILERLGESQRNVTRQRGYRNAFIGVVVLIVAALLLTDAIVPAVGGVVRFVVGLVVFCGLYALGLGILQVFRADASLVSDDDSPAASS